MNHSDEEVLQRAQELVASNSVQDKEVILKQKLDTDNKIRFVQGVGSRLENSIYNSIEMKHLMDLESQGLGDMTLTQILNVCQDMYNSGETEMFFDLMDRKKPINPSKVEELLLEIATYRAVMRKLQSQLKREKGSKLHSYAEAINLLIEKIDSGWRVDMNED